MEMGPRELGRMASKGSVRPRSRRDPQVTEIWEGSGNVEETGRIQMESKEDSGWNHWSRNGCCYRCCPSMLPWR